MATIDALLQRNSHARLVEPGPDDEALSLILRAAARAPDHGRLRPWRFVVVAGERLELGAGDVAAFAGDQRHSYENPGRSPAVAFSVVTLAPVAAG